MDDYLSNLATFYQIDSNFPLKEGSVGEKQFQVLLNQIAKKEHLIATNTYKSQNPKQFFSNILMFYNKVFSQDMEQHLFPYFSLTKFDPAVSSGVYQSADDTSLAIKIDSIYLEGYQNTWDLISGIHEYMHAFLMEDYTLLSNVYYTELFSIFIEKAAAVYFEKQKVDQNILYRLNGERLADIKSCLQNQLLIPNLYEEQKFRTDMYLLSDIYATHLFSLYHEEQAPVFKDIIHLFQGKANVEELLDDYGISLQNKETFNAYQKVLKQYR